MTREEALLRLKRNMAKAQETASLWFPFNREKDCCCQGCKWGGDPRWESYLARQDRRSEQMTNIARLVVTPLVRSAAERLFWDSRFNRQLNMVGSYTAAMDHRGVKWKFELGSRKHHAGHKIDAETIINWPNLSVVAWVGGDNMYAHPYTVTGHFMRWINEFTWHDRLEVRHKELEAEEAKLAAKKRATIELISRGWWLP